MSQKLNNYISMKPPTTHCWRKAVQIKTNNPAVITKLVILARVILSDEEITAWHHFIINYQLSTIKLKRLWATIVLFQTV